MIRRRTNVAHRSFGRCLQQDFGAAKDQVALVLFVNVQTLRRIDCVDRLLQSCNQHKMQTKETQSKTGMKEKIDGC